MSLPLQEPLPFDTAPTHRAPDPRRGLRAVPIAGVLTPQPAAETATQATQTAPTCRCGGDPIGHVHPDRREIMP